MAKTTGSSVRERVAESRPIRVSQFAMEVGLAPSTVYGLIRDKKIAAIRIGASILIPADVAAPLLGMSVPLPTPTAEAA